MSPAGSLFFPILSGYLRFCHRCLPISKVMGYITYAQGTFDLAGREETLLFCHPELFDLS